MRMTDLNQDNFHLGTYQVESNGLSSFSRLIKIIFR